MPTDTVMRYVRLISSRASFIGLLEIRISPRKGAFRSASFLLLRRPQRTQEERGYRGPVRRCEEAETQKEESQPHDHEDQQRNRDPPTVFCSIWITSDAIKITSSFLVLNELLAAADQETQH
jgi:hypothetical protein